MMAVLELTDEQVLQLLQQLPDEQRKRVLNRMAQPAKPKPRPRFGSAKEDIQFIAADFDAPLDDFKDYM